jgi:hypothetical protein
VNLLLDDRDIRSGRMLGYANPSGGKKQAEDLHQLRRLLSKAAENGFVTRRYEP